MKAKAQGKQDYKFDFIRLAPIFTTTMILAMLLSIVMVFVKGFNYGIDFAGGVEMQVKFNRPVEMAHVRDVLEKQDIKSLNIQPFGDNSEALIRFEVGQGKSEKETSDLTQARIKSVGEVITQSFADAGPQIRKVESVGPQVGSQLKHNSILATFYSLLLILIYVGLRFDYKYAPGAIICSLSDMMIIVGFLVVFEKEINLQTMAAVLTLIGYSLNDTIVVYDRIRETEHMYKDRGMYYVINKAANDMLSRTILTSVTVLISLAIIHYYSVGAIRDFALTMLIGVFIGTFSSIYTAAPFILLYEYLFDKKKKRATA